MKRPPLGSLVVAVVGSLFSIHAGAQSPEQSTAHASGQAGQDLRPASVLKVTTRLVLVDVVVTDHRGRAVPGLTEDDFSVLEEGKSERLRSFNFEQGISNDTEAAPQPSRFSDPAPGVFTNKRRWPGGGALNVLLLDGLNTRMDKQSYVRTQMIELLKALPAGRPLAIYLLGNKLQLLQEFTSDPEVLKGVLAHFDPRRPALMDNASGGPAAFWLEGIPLSPDVRRTMLEFQQERESEQTDQRVAVTMDSLSKLARALAGYPGRKNLIWISEAFPYSLVPSRYPFGDSASRAARQYGPVMAEVANRMTDAQIAVYPIDARGHAGAYAFTASTNYDSSGNALSSPGAVMHSQADTREELASSYETMHEIAKDTGGLATRDNDIGNAVRHSMDDGSTYYTLGYYPQNQTWDGRFRKITVKVSRPGTKLRYRAGYFALGDRHIGTVGLHRGELELAANLVPDVPIATALGFDASVVPPTGETKEQVLVNFAVDPRAVSFSEAADGKKLAQIECAVRAFAAANSSKALQTKAETIEANMPPEIYQQVMRTALPCQVKLSVPPGEYLLRLGVLDQHTGLIGTANAKLTVPANPPNGPGEAKN